MSTSSTDETAEPPGAVIAPSLAEDRAAISRQDLWPHQRDAVDMAIKTLHDQPRTTVVAACGAGKTRIGGQVAAELLHGDDKLLIVAPTLDLIAQTLAEYEGWFGRAALGRLVAVCSDQRAVAHSMAELTARRVVVTTDAAALARELAEPGRATVACTYQSLVVLRDAHTRHGLPGWSLAVVDEAHRTAGARGKSWGLIHDDAAIPAERRLYLTATPRLLSEERDDAVGMDDERIFGPVCYRLTFAEAIERGLLADYQVLVPVITDAAVRDLVVGGPDGVSHLSSGSMAVSAAVLATQVALLRAVHEHGIRRVVTYHHRVADATAFATSLPAAAGLLELHERPTPLAAFEIDGYQPPEKRRAILGRLATDDPGVVVVANARVLAEGVNVPAIDAVAFIDARDSPESTAQAVGRALRLGGRVGKIATIIVPVLLGADETPESALEGSAYAPVWRTIRALRAHDSGLGDRLDKARFELARRQYQPADEVFEMPGWLRLTGVPVPDGFARAISVRMVQATTSPWQEGYALACTYHERHGHLMPGPDEQALNDWLIARRKQRKHGELSAERIAELDALGMVWDVYELAWATGLAALRSYRAEHGHANPGLRESWGTPPHPVGRWLSAARSQHRRAALSPSRVADLEALGVSWDPVDDQWQAHLAALRSYRAKYGHVNVPPGTMWGRPPLPLGTWISSQRSFYQKGRLSTERIAALDQLGMSWSMRAEQWTRALAIVQDFHREHGHLRVPDGTRRGQPSILLNEWLDQQRADRRRGLLSAQQIAALDQLGFSWQPRGETRWNNGLAAAQACFRQRGTLIAPRDATFGDPPVKLGTWLGNARRRREQGRLTDAQIADLDALGMVWKPYQDTWTRNIEALRGYLAAHDGTPPTTADPCFDEPSINVYDWLLRQRRAYRGDKLPAERVAQLAELLGAHWAEG